MNALDIETYESEDGKIIPYCLCYLIDGNMYTYYYINDNYNIIYEGIINILNNFKNKIIYVHNINFDGFIIIDNLSNTDVEINGLFRDMNIYSLKLSKNNNYIEIRCSYKIIPNSLREISKSFNVGEKDIFPHKFAKKYNLFYEGKVPNFEYFNSYEEHSEFVKKYTYFNFREISINYCKNDVIITSKFLLKIENLLSSFNIKLENILTAPSLALRIFINKFNKQRISFKLNPILEDTIRTSYFGGRCEVYGNAEKDEKVFYYDFSGMYGQCMSEDFPYGLTFFQKNPKDFSKPGFYFIEYYSCVNIPILPHKSSLNSKLLFTNGYNSGLFWFEEIILFLENGGIVNNIKFAFIFNKFGKIFIEYVNFFNEIKNISNVHKNFGKLMINSLYGRMGMSFLKDETIIIDEKDFLSYQKKENIKNFKKINKIIIMSIEKDIYKKSKSNIIMASCITSKARIKLYKAQKDVVNNGGRVLYSDTDSIFAAYKKDVSNEIHGIINWSKENKNIEDSVFISSKTYGLKYKNTEEIKIKGFNDENIKFNELKNKFYTESSIKTNQNYLDRKNIEIMSKKIIKDLNLSNYDKRKFSKDKKNTRPLVRINEFKYI